MEDRLGSAEDAPIRARRVNTAARQPVVEPQMADGRDDDERAYDQRADDTDRELSDAERLEMFQDSQIQSVLPDLPPMPGYHICWLTTSNPRDSIQNRVRLGYELIRADTMKGWEGVSHKTGDYSGIVGLNEMVAARIPNRLYQMYMAETHHRAPLNEESKIRAQAELLKRNAEEMGAKVQEGDGMAELARRVGPAPVFE